MFCIIMVVVLIYEALTAHLTVLKIVKHEATKKLIRDIVGVKVFRVSPI